MWRRPPVSRITHVAPVSVAFCRPLRHASSAVAPATLCTATSSCRPSVSSCSTAAGRRMSPATSSALWPPRLRWRASLAAVVVLPDPCRPTSISTAGGRSEPVRREDSPPSMPTSSSLTILTICWPGLRCSQHLAADGTLPHLLHEVARHAEVDIGLKHGKAHLSQPFLHVTFGQAALAGEPPEDRVQLLGQGVKHRSPPPDPAARAANCPASGLRRGRTADRRSTFLR